MGANQRGFTLISGILAMGIAGLLALFVTQVLKDQFGSTKGRTLITETMAPAALLIKKVNEDLKTALRVEKETAGFQRIRIHYREFNETLGAIEDRSTVYEILNDTCQTGHHSIACKKVTRTDHAGNTLDFIHLMDITWCVDDGTDPCPAYPKPPGVSSSSDRFILEVSYVSRTLPPEKQVSSEDFNSSVFVIHLENYCNCTPMSSVLVEKS